MRHAHIMQGGVGLLGALLFQPSTVGAQARPADTLRLSLADLLARVTVEHPTVHAGIADVQAARARAAQLRRYANPSLDIEHLTFSEADNVALLQPIRWPWESAALRDLGSAQVASATAGAEVERRAVALEAAQRFVDGLRAARALALAVEAESLAQGAVERAVAARQLGQVGDLAVLQAQVSLDAARRARLGSEADLQASRAGLIITIGVDPTTPIVLQGDLASLASLGTSDSTLARASVGDPEAARLQAEAERAAQDARLARVRRWPELALGPSGTFGTTTTVGLSVGLGIPLWNRQGAAIRAATADREAALARLDARRREFAVIVFAARTTVARTDRELALLRSGELARAAQAEALAARAMQEGGPYVVAWLTARQAYLDARRAELDLEWQAARARLLLRHLSGTLLAEEVR
jgi:outer membrane protein, heavy metal efflux system